MGKCPKCKKTFPATKAGYKAYQKHYYDAHVPDSQKAKSKRNGFVYKPPGYTAKKRRKR